MVFDNFKERFRFHIFNLLDIRSILEEISSSQYVRALQLRGALYLAANLRT